MSVETIQEKAGRLLATGRLTVRSLTVDAITAGIVGDHGSYRVGCDPSGWYCDCPAFTRRCSHIVALKQVTLSTDKRSSPDDLSANERYEKLKPGPKDNSLLPGNELSAVDLSKNERYETSRSPQDPNVKTFTNSTGRKEPAT